MNTTNNMNTSDILKLDISIFTELRKKLFDILQKKQKPLHQVVRYRMFEYIVPIEIEGVTKYSILHFDTLKENTVYSFTHTHGDKNGKVFPVEVRFSYVKKDENYVVSQTRNGIARDEESFSIRSHEKYREIEYKNKIYQSVADSGTVRLHENTQLEDITEYSRQDYVNGIITQIEQIMFEILHLFHDMPEENDLEVCNNETKTGGKNEQQCSEEQKKGIIMIQNMETLSDLEKSILTTIYLHDNKKSLFKFWEHLRRTLYDTMLFYKNRDKHHNWKKIVGEMSFSFLGEIFQEFETFSGKKVIPIELQSIQKKLREYATQLDMFLNLTEHELLPYVHPQRQKEFEERKNDWQKIKTILNI